MLNALDPVQAKLEASRKELLDLGLRNPLLNHRPARARGVDVVDEQSVEVFRILVAESKAMAFAPAPDVVEEPGLAQPEPTGEAAKPAARHQDTWLQTGLATKRLQSVLLNTHYSARTFIEEQGVNVLYLALGMLNWYEADSAQEPRRAPLVLVPVELARSSAAERFTLRYTQDELGDNLSLRAKLKSEFGLALPPLPAAEDLDVAAYMAEVAEAVARQGRWKVDPDAIALGFFSFGKFLMYRDLDGETWLDGAKPAEHPLIRSLLEAGFQEPGAAVSDEDHLDAHLGPLELPTVVDADSSQMLAMLDVQSGRNLVIQGPPGTGKSQTITNVIAQAVGAGKKVLFVSEKMAALEVVKRRLDSVGLGDACLELHSHKSNKKALLSELQRTVQLGRPRLSADQSASLALMGELRERLNDYCEAVNAPIAQSGLAPHQALGELLRIRRSLGGEPLPRLAIATMSEWDAAGFKRREAVVSELQQHLAAMGPLTGNPFYGAQRSTLLPTELEGFRGRLAEARRALDALTAAAAVPASALGIEPPVDARALLGLVQAAERLGRSPDLRGVAVADPAWGDRADEIHALVAAGERLGALRARFEPLFIPEAWSQDLLPTRQAIAAHGRKWWKFLIGDYRQAKARLAGLCRQAPPEGVDAQLEAIDALLEARRLDETLQRLAPLGAQLFGDRWRLAGADWPGLAVVAGWLIDLHADARAGRLPAAAIGYVAAHPSGGGVSAEAARGPFEALEALWPTLVEFLAWGPETAHALLAMPFAAQRARLDAWAAHPEALSAVVRLNHFLARCRQEGLEVIVPLIGGWPLAGAHLLDAFRTTWYEFLVEAAYRDRPALLHFDGDGHLHAIERFQALDRLTFLYHRAKLASAHWEALPRTDAGGQLGVLTKEFEKKSRHMPIRRLMEKAGVPIQAIKPVFMMSPLSIAGFLPPGSVTFDLVIFDEASQVKPVDAFGALLRGKRVVVVGDKRQMPPTNFFDSVAAVDEDEETETGDIESILGLFEAQGAPQRMLRWHYRSRHESLIAVSNREFYEGRLVVFPSPDGAREETGLAYHHLPHTAYDRGASRANAGEAQVVAEAVMHHARTRPHLTLGVAAFSTAQQSAIQDQLEILRRQDPSCEPFFSTASAEPFFVKNLETIQGDERDVIYISVGYGRSADGYLSMNFGPLNRDGGERRLNVLITRARRRCEVFTNLAPEDIDLHATQARGVRALKLFLTYAATGRMDVATPTGKGTDSPFEDMVLAELRALGHQVEPQVGSAGFFIDLAVVDPDRPGRYLLGIECDGATYHSARSARDRDRLRQQVLEDLGWRIHRIWSTDWFKHPERELKRLVAAIEEARNTRVETPSPAPAVDAHVLEREAPAEAPPSAPAVPVYLPASLAIQLGDQELSQVAPAAIAQWVAQVVDAEGPVHVAEVARRLMSAAGVKRTGTRIQSAIDAGIAAALRGMPVERRGDFLWKQGFTLTGFRDRGSLPAASRKIELIAPEEVALAIEAAVRDSFGLEPTQLPASVGRLFGFGRLNDEAKAQLEAIVGQMVQEKRLEVRGGHIVLGERAGANLP